MKKLLGSTLALAMFVPAGANAELLKNLKISGQLDISAVNANNITDYVSGPTGPNSTPANSDNRDRIGAAYTRTMLKADWDLLDDVHARINLTKGNSWFGNQRAYGQQAESLQAVQNEVTVEEANIKIDKLFGFADTTIGKQFYGQPGDLIVYYGPRDSYGLYVTALDAFRFDWNGDKFGITGVVGKSINGGGTINAGNNFSEDIRGLVVNVKGNETVSGAGYIYNREKHLTNGNGAGSQGAKNDFLYILGVKGKVTKAGLTVNGELAKNLGQYRPSGGLGSSGSDAAYSGWAMLLNAAFKADLEKVGAITPWGEFGYGSGRSRSDSNHQDGFVSINSDYRPGGIYGRFDCTDETGAWTNLGSNGECSNGLSNRTIYGFGVKVTPAALSKLTAGVQYYHYAFTRTSDRNFFGAGPWGGTQQYPRSIGTEYDVTAEWKHSENVGLKLTLGTFQPGAYVYANRQPNAAVSPATMMALDTTVRF
jgi:hypothetical protein